MTARPQDYLAKGTSGRVFRTGPTSATHPTSELTLSGPELTLSGPESTLSGPESTLAGPGSAFTDPDSARAGSDSALDAALGFGAASGTGSGPTPIILGVSAALSRRLGISVAVVRAIFTTLAVAGGIGIVIYLLVSVFWRNRLGSDLEPSASRDLGAVLLMTGFIWELGALWPGVRATLVLPVGLVAVGVALGWRNTPIGVDDLVSSARSDSGSNAGVGHGTAAKGRSTSRRARQLVLRMVGGTVLCIGGFAVLLGQSADIATLRDAILGLLVAFAGVALVVGPSTVRFVRSFSIERDDRVRAEERARVAAHLHDSVLQTLTLIQKESNDPAATAALARHQERSLRRWLYGTNTAYGTGDGDSGIVGWRATFEEMVGSVEDHYATAIELVMVGEGEIGADSVVDQRDRSGGEASMLAAIVAAAREGLINASKFSGETHLSIYCELGENRFDVFVRDRGRGFDMDSIDPDRRGVRDSIVARMFAVGGQANIRTSPGQGTEVALSVPVRPRSSYRSQEA
ncbi:MAG: hypothetical protein WBA45_12515 [Microthrixaceae bacterium]